MIFSIILKEKETTENGYVEDVRSFNVEFLR